MFCIFHNIFMHSNLHHQCNSTISAKDVGNDKGYSQERRWLVFKEVRDSVISVLQMPLSLRHLLHRGSHIAKALMENRPKRPRQA